MMKFIKSVPVAICGLSLGLAALGNLLLPLGAEVRYVCGILSLIVLIVFALKVFLDSPHALEEFKTPVPLSVTPTATMAIMLLSTYIRPHAGTLALVIWCAAVALHVSIMLVFFKRFIIGFKIANVYPTWFIPFVGIVTAAVTAPAMGFRQFGQAVFWIGFVLYFVALVLVITKKRSSIFVPEPLTLTSAIFTAPMSLLIVGYFSSFQERTEALVYIMSGIAAISYIYVTVIMLKKLLKARFYPTYSAFTFPYVISALAFRLVSGFLSERGITFMAPAATITMWIAVLLVAYVFISYIRYFRFVLKF